MPRTFLLRFKCFFESYVNGGFKFLQDGLKKTTQNCVSPIKNNVQYSVTFVLLSLKKGKKSVKTDKKRLVMFVSIAILEFISIPFFLKRCLIVIHIIKSHCTLFLMLGFLLFSSALPPSFFLVPHDYDCIDLGLHSGILATLQMAYI